MSMLMVCFKADAEHFEHSFCIQHCANNWPAYFAAVVDDTVSFSLRIYVQCRLQGFSFRGYSPDGE